MSVSAVFAALATKLQTVNPAPQPVPARVYANPEEALSLGDSPSIILTLAMQQENTIEASAGDDCLDYYKICMYVIVGMRSTGIPELHQRCLPWARAISKVLSANLTLGGLVEYIGDKGSNQLFTYTVGPIKWAGDDYFGLKIILPVMERFNNPVGP